MLLYFGPFYPKKSFLKYKYTHQTPSDHTDDPVDEWEESRNDKIYENWQENRNPFIDHQEFADLIWNYSNDEENENPIGTMKIYPNPFFPEKDKNLFSHVRIVYFWGWSYFTGNGKAN